MNIFSKALVIHNDRQKATEIAKALSRSLHCQVKFAFLGMEAVQLVTLHRPELVVFHHGMMDLPADPMVKALRQLDPNLCLVVSAEADSSEIKAIVSRNQLRGSFIAPFNPERVTALFAQLGSSNEEPDIISGLETTMNRLMPLEIPYGYETSGKHAPLLLDGRDLSQLRVFRHPGSLRVLGDLREMEELEVGGSLIVQGSIFHSRVRCRGPVNIKGRIVHCPSGIFSRTDLSVGGIEFSKVLAGRNLFLSGPIKESQIFVVERLVAKSETASLVGGRTVVGEHLSVASLGDTQHCLTRVELAPTLLFAAWSRSKKETWAHTVADQEVQRVWYQKKAKLFENQIKNLKFFQMLAEVVGQKVYPGVEWRFGDYEDFTFESRLKGFRAALGRQKSGKMGICLRSPEHWRKLQQLRDQVRGSKQQMENES